MAKLPGTFQKVGQRWTSHLECLDCGQVYTHVEMSPAADDEPDHEVPFPCSDCGGSLVRLAAKRETIRYEAGSRLDLL